MNVISNLQLKQFRSYDDFAIELSSEVNIIVGPNASGKTNLLESVLLICGASTYRAQLNDVIMHNKEWSRIEALFGDFSRSVNLEVVNNSVSKKYILNEVSRQRLRYEDILPIVLFEPENMRLLTGSPDLRRDFLDEILSTIDPIFINSKKHYLRVLAQRNKLLKTSKKVPKQQLFVWNVRLSELAGYIVGARLKLIDELNQQIKEVYSQIAGNKTEAKITYQTDIKEDNYESNLMAILERDIELDLERGFTSHGPHRDDFEVVLNYNNAKSTASRGETRTMVLSLKLLQVRLIMQKRDIKPIILLDDVFSELDGYRRKALTNYLNKHQTIITTTDADVISKGFAQNTNIVSLR